MVIENLGVGSGWFNKEVELAHGWSVIKGANKMKDSTKLTVVMCCQIVAQKSVAPSIGDFRRRPAPRYV